MDDGLVALMDPVCLQGEFDTLTVFFYRVRLRKNSGMTVRMIYCPFRAVGKKSEAVYE